MTTNDHSLNGRKRARAEGSRGPPVALSLLSGVFTDREPKHIGHGLADAARNVAVGLGMGVSGLIALPIAGCREQGAAGIAKGLGVGLLGLAGGTVAGVALGVWQFGRGVMNTKTAVKETVLGKRYWCRVSGKWINVNLDDMLATVPMTDDDIYSEARNQGHKVSWMNRSFPFISRGEGATDDTPSGEPNASVEKDYYSIMDIDTGASAAEIRSAYLRKALQLHPDKNGGDKNAAQRFQDVVEAYSVLSDEARRSQYDAYGAACVDNRDVEDIYCQLEKFLGAQQLEPFIGRVGWVIHFKPNAYFTNELRTELGRRRALRMVRYLLRLVDGDEAALEAARQHIEDAVSTRGGAIFMPLVAEQYTMAARQHLTQPYLRRKMVRFGASKLAFLTEVKGATKVCVKTAYKAARKRLNENDIVEVVLTICKHDVQSAVLYAAHLLLHDSSAAPEQLNRRAQRLIKISQMITEICATSSASGGEAATS